MKTPAKTKTTIRFNLKLAEPKAAEKSGSWILTLPKSADAKLPSKNEVTVEGMINHLPFRAALNASKGGYTLNASKAMRDTVGMHAGEAAEVEITRVEDEPEIRVPADLWSALRAVPKSLASWKDITPMARRDWIFSICEAKQTETRTRRIKKACDMLSTGKRRLCCFPGVKWLMKENAKSCGMWLPLPKPEKKS